MESFLDHLADERRLSSNTLSAYRNDLSQFESYFHCERERRLGPRSVAAGSSQGIGAAAREEVVDFFLFLHERGYAPATIARKMAAVKSLFQFLCRRGDISINPSERLDSPEIKKPVPRAISLGDIDALMREATKRPSAEGLRDLAMLQVLCATGVRVTELVSLNLEDLDLPRRRVCCTGRNGRRRELPLEDRVVEGLGEYLRESRPKLLRSDQPTEALFLNHRGRRLTRQGFWLIMKAMVRESGVAGEVTPHTLRHSFAAHRLQDGLELHRLRDLLGHANISTTQIYTQVRVESGPTSPLVERDPVAV